MPLMVFGLCFKVGNYSWVNPGVLSTRSSLNDVESLSGVGAADKSLEGKWRIKHPGDDKGMCSSYNGCFLLMYEVVFQKKHIKASFH